MTLFFLNDYDFVISRKKKLNLILGTAYAGPIFAEIGP